MKNTYYVLYYELENTGEYHREFFSSKEFAEKRLEEIVSTRDISGFNIYELYGSKYIQQNLFIEDINGNLKPNPYITGEKKEPKQMELDLH